MIRILVDSSSDYPVEEIRQKNLELVPISITIGEHNYIEGKNLDRDTFYEILTDGREIPKTSQPSPQDFLTCFEQAKKNGDELICILLSSALSGTYQSAVLAKSMADYDGIYLIDSLAATVNIKILADYALCRIAAGDNAAEVVAAVECLKPRVKVIAALDTLEYLRRGGRIGRAASLIGEMANIKPVITLLEDGTIGAVGKCLGRNKAVSSLINRVAELSPDPAFPVYSIYTYGTDNSERFEQKLVKTGISIAGRMQIGATIGTHIGPGAFGLAFVANE
ncbi:MAG: DegV family protein [Lachnospiraceae bacterium]|uniref:DegV family protein n=1 Tax=Parablautia sp. Marseille-Q6255 TaxID=3039593 RepID=UPI0024BC2397|nr:DegV family protein [Parablautia sp. Marseille-Q6255]